MNKKEGLSSVQRKMLDEIYTEQFETITEPILRKREVGLDALRTEVLRDEAKKEPMKEVLAACIFAHKAIKKAEKYMEDNGLSLDHGFGRDEVELRLDNSYRTVTHPRIAEYEEETSNIKISLAKKKKEIRARIYGMDTTYEEVEREIKKEIESIKS